jgi:putative ABC transport system substrate-binding protein
VLKLRLVGMTPISDVDMIDARHSHALVAKKKRIIGMLDSRIFGGIKMQRREFMTLLAGAALGAPRTALAQSSSKVYRLGTLTAAAPINEKTPTGATLLRVLEQRGYTIGKNLSLDARAAMGHVSKLPELVRGLKAANVDVIVTTGFPATLACKVENLPTVVALGAGDPVTTNLIDGLARPGGSITGISDNATTLSTKRLALIKQAVPRCCGTGAISA